MFNTMKNPEFSLENSGSFYVLTNANATV